MALKTTIRNKVIVVSVIYNPPKNSGKTGDGDDRQNRGMIDVVKGFFYDYTEKGLNWMILIFRNLMRG